MWTIPFVTSHLFSGNRRENRLCTMARAANFQNVSELNLRELHNATSHFFEIITWLRGHKLLVIYHDCKPDKRLELDLV